MNDQKVGTDNDYERTDRKNTQEEVTMENNVKKNGSGYNDPTAYKAIMNVGGEKNNNEHASWRYFLCSK